MSSKKNEKKYIEYLQSIIENVNTSHSKKYNIEAVSMLLKIPIVDNYKKQCELLIDYVKKNKNKFLKDLIKNTTNDQDICKIMVNSIYTLFYPENFPNKSPINITEKKYRELIELKKKNKISKKQGVILEEAMNKKYCHCLKSLFLQEKFFQTIKNNYVPQNVYPICMSSIYNSRNIKPPKRVSYSCSKKYAWYN
tara:strand:- start:782 stop:1366 length:585 start_codon:yes stop_codon:yes gene_type:complete